MNRSVQQVLMTLAAALGGAAIGQFLGLPAGPLVGSTLAVTALAATGAKLKVNPVLRNLAFTAIGVSLGAGVTPDFLSDVLHYPASLAMLTVTIILVMAVSGTVLQRFFHVSPTTAVLATTPGALSYTLSLASERRAEETDSGFVMGMQSLRLFMITIFLPPAIAVIGEAAGGTSVSFAARNPLDTPHSLILIAVATIGGFLFDKLKLPAAYILAGAILSGIAHGIGLVDGQPAKFLTFVGFSLAGAVIGVRFSAISSTQIRKLLKAGIIMSTLAVTISGLMSYLAAWLLHLPLGQVWVSFAPGGVEGMSAMALSLGYDPAYVATHHIFRLILILAFLPLVLRQTARMTTNPKRGHVQ